MNGFAKIAAPLTDLTKKKNPFKWEKREENSFTELKRALTNAPVLKCAIFSLGQISSL